MWLMIILYTALAIIFFSAIQFLDWDNMPINKIYSENRLQFSNNLTFIISSLFKKVVNAGI